jgi:anion-transporting  ArsA/GET3 family ATPase
MNIDLNIDELIDKNEVIVCAGSGGVGKTTTSATIAIRAALRGKKVLVCTIDPAKRLANSLGIEELSGVEREVEPTQFAAAGAPMQGSLTALMIDMKRSFDELVERHAPSAEIKDKIFTNRLYKNVSSALGGSQEYIAMQKLADLHESRRFDLIILDTPPARHALDFLEAPSKITEFFTARVVDWFFKPGARVGKTGYRLFQKSGSAFLNILEKLTGEQLLSDMADFFENFDELLVEFKRQGETLQRLLASEKVVFLVVTAPDQLASEETVRFADQLRQRRLRFGGYVVNRVHRSYGIDLEQSEQTVAALKAAPAPGALPGGAETYGKLVDNLGRFLELAKSDMRCIADLARKADGRVAAVPFFDKDVYDIPDLLAINAHLGKQVDVSLR